MKRWAIIFPLMVLGLIFGAKDVPAQNPQNAELHPPYLSEDEGVVVQEGEEDEVIERGVRRFKLKPRKRILVPQKPAGGTKKFRLKRRPFVPSTGNSNPPPGGSLTPSVEPPDSVEPPGPLEPPEFVESPSQCVWHTSDIIDQRIDVSAQERLMAMMSRGGEERRDASAMIGAVKQGALSGILLAPRKAVSDRGQRMTPPKGWWELIPQGQLGTCLQEPVGEPPMILYRDQNGEAMLDPSVIVHTLRTGWGQCGLPTPDPACSYLVDLHKPPPDSPDQQSEGYGELQVFVKGEGKAMQGVQVSVRAIRKGSPGHENYQNDLEPEKGLMLTHFTNDEGIAAFLIPPVENRISVYVAGPPGFYNSTSVLGFLPKDTKGISVELEPIPLMP